MKNVFFGGSTEKRVDTMKCEQIPPSFPFRTFMLL